MNLLLTSNGFIDSPIEKDFLEMVHSKKNLKIAMIPTASDPIKWIPDNHNPKKFIAKLMGDNQPKKSKEYLYYKKKGYQIVIVDLKGDPNHIEKKLRNVDLIHVGGGDVNYLLEWVKKSGLDTYLKELLENGVVYIGASAGNGIIQPDIGFTWWEPDDPTDHVGLGIIDFIMCVHHEDDSLKNIRSLRKRKKYLQRFINFNWKIYLVKDGQAMKCLENKCEHIGEGEKKYI